MKEFKWDLFTIMTVLTSVMLLTMMFTLWLAEVEREGLLNRAGLKKIIFGEDE